MIATEPSVEAGSGIEGEAGRGGCALSLLFANGTRPTATRIAACSDRPAGLTTGFLVSQPLHGAENGLELTAQGLSFDLAGLAPGLPALPPTWHHTFGLDGPELPPDLEAVRLTAGAHLSGGGALLPVVRAITGIATELIGLGGVRAICWHPAGTCIETALFARIIGAWLDGGPFPVHGLMALRREAGGAVRGEGLAFFIGQELQLEAARHRTGPETAKAAVGLIQDLIEDGPLHSAGQLVASDGECLDAEPSHDGSLLRVWRRVTVAD